MKSTSKLYFNILMCLVFAFTASCSKDTDNESDQEILTGEALFREIIFTEGPAFSKDLPEYSEYITNVKQSGFENGVSFSEFRNFTERFIQQLDPDFFDNFKAIIYERNPYHIKEVFSKSLSLVSISEILYTSDSEAKSYYRNLINQVDISNVVVLQKTAKELYLNHRNIKNASISNDVVVVDTDPSIDFALPPPCLITGVACNIAFRGPGQTLNKYQEIDLLNEKMVHAIIKNY